MNFWRDVVVRAGRPRAGRGPARASGPSPRSPTAAAERAGALHAAGVRRGDVVLTLIGNRPEWVIAMVACFRQGYVVLPCNEQLRAKDLRARLDITQPTAVVADPRNADRPARGRLERPDPVGRRRAGARPRRPRRRTTRA